MTFTGRAYGWREALWSLPRFIIGNSWRWPRSPVR